MSVRVTGLRELRKELRALEDDATWKPRLRQAGLGAAQIVASDAGRSAAASRMGSRAAATYRALAGQTRATVAAGSAAIPWVMGHEWGSSRYRQFPAVNRGGYHLYPAITRQRDKVIEYYADALEDIVGDAFPN